MDEVKVFRVDKVFLKKFTEEDIIRILTNVFGVSSYPSLSKCGKILEAIKNHKFRVKNDTDLALCLITYLLKKSDKSSLKYLMNMREEIVSLSNIVLCDDFFLMKSIKTKGINFIHKTLEPFLENLELKNITDFIKPKFELKEIQKEIDGIKKMNRILKSKPFSDALYFLSVKKLKFNQEKRILFISKLNNLKLFEIQLVKDIKPRYYNVLTNEDVTNEDLLNNPSHSSITDPILKKISISASISDISQIIYIVSESVEILLGNLIPFSYINALFSWNPNDYEYLFLKWGFDIKDVRIIEIGNKITPNLNLLFKIDKPEKNQLVVWKDNEEYYLSEIIDILESGIKIVSPKGRNPKFVVTSLKNLYMLQKEEVIETQITINRGKQRELLKSMFNCSISQSKFINPVVIKCGHTFSESFIKEWFKISYTCPECKMKVDPNFLIKNIRITSILSELSKIK